MSDTPFPLDQWVHYYQQQQQQPTRPSVGEFSDSTTPITTTDNSSTTVGGSPPAQVQAQARPIRRRSRASRRTPTTLLNASATNFRALVQQFTGCQAVASSSFAPPVRGPVNLNFGHSSATNDLTTNSGFTYNYNQNMPSFQQQQFQDQQRMLAYRNGSIDPSHNVQNNNMGDFVPEDNSINLGEFVEQSALTRTGSDRGYFY